MSTITIQNERTIITALFNELKSHGFTVNVFDGEKNNENQTLDEVLGWYNNLDEMSITAINDQAEKVGTAYFCFNNGDRGIFCMYDNSCSLEQYITETEKLTEKMATIQLSVNRSYMNDKNKHNDLCREKTTFELYQT